MWKLKHLAVKWHPNIEPEY